MPAENDLRAILQDTVQAAEAFELDNKALRARLAELEESSNLRQTVAARQSGRERRSSASSRAQPSEWWQEELEELNVEASLYDDGHVDIVRELIRSLRDMVPKTAASAQLRDVQVRLRTLGSIIDSWQRKYADVRQKAVGYLRDLEAAKSAQEDFEEQQSMVKRLAGEAGWIKLSDDAGNQAAHELEKYIALFEKEAPPECDSSSKKAWILDKYAQLRYRHRELFVRCELVQRENAKVEQEFQSMKVRLEEAESRAQKHHEEARTAAADGHESIHQLKVVRNKEVKEARSAGVELSSDSEIYSWTKCELQRLRDELADEKANSKRQDTQLSSLQASLEVAKAKNIDLTRSDAQLREQHKRLEQENEQIDILKKKLGEANQKMRSFEAGYNRLKDQVDLAQSKLNDAEDEFTDLQQQHEVTLQTFEAPSSNSSVKSEGASGPDQPQFKTSSVRPRAGGSSRDLFLTLTNQKASGFFHAQMTAEDVLSQHEGEREQHGHAKKQLNNAVGVLRNRIEGTAAEHRLQKHTVRHDLVLALANVAATQGRECLQESRMIHIEVLQKLQRMLLEEMTSLTDSDALQSYTGSLLSKVQGLDAEIQELHIRKTSSMCSMELYRTQGQLSALEKNRRTVGDSFATSHSKLKNSEHMAELELAECERRRLRLHQCLSEAGAMNEMVEFLQQFEGLGLPPTHAIDSEVAWVREEEHMIRAEYDNGQSATSQLGQYRTKLFHSQGMLEFCSHLSMDHEADSSELLRIDLHAKLEGLTVYAASRSGAMQVRSAAQKKFNRTHGALSILRALTSNGDAEQFLERCGTEVEAERKRLMNAITSEEALHEQLNSTHRQQGYVDFMLEHGNLSKDKAAEQLEHTEHLPAVKSEIQYAKQVQRRFDQMQGKQDMIQECLERVELVQTDPQEWMHFLDDSFAERTRARREAHFILRGTMTLSTEQEDIQKQVQQLRGQLQAVMELSKSTVKSETKLANVYADLRMDATIAAAKMSAMGQDYRAFEVAENRLIALHAAQTFIRRDLSTRLTNRSARMQHRQELQAQQQAAQSHAEKLRTVDLRLNRADKNFRRMSLALPTLESKLRSIRGFLDAGVLEDWSHESSVARRDLERLRSEHQDAKESQSIHTASVNEKLKILSAIEEDPTAKTLVTDILSQLDRQEILTRHIIKETQSARDQYKAASHSVDAAIGALHLLSRSMLFDPDESDDADAEFFKEIQKVFETAGHDVTAVGAAETDSRVAERQLLVNKGAMEAVEGLQRRVAATGKPGGMDDVKFMKDVTIEVEHMRKQVDAEMEAALQEGGTDEAVLELEAQLAAARELVEQLSGSVHHEKLGSEATVRL